MFKIKKSHARSIVCICLTISVGFVVFALKRAGKTVRISNKGRVITRTSPTKSSRARATAPRPTEPPANQDVTFAEEDMVDEKGGRYHIVIVHPFMHQKPGYLANPSVCRANVSCEITSDLARIDAAHALVFRDYSAKMHREVLQARRQPWQLYAWWVEENPLHASGSADFGDYFYNLTFHYRRDADVYAPYGSVNLILDILRGAGEPDLDALMAAKRRANKTAAWAVSNCYRTRMAFAKRLMDAGLAVDTFGGCWGGRQIGDGRYSTSFYRELGKYKFYFAFENSVRCKDYITEKFWFNGLRSGAVPVVWGPRKSDVLAVAPRHSFIHADDFRDADALVRYLNRLAANEDEYRKYLEWRTWAANPGRIEPRLRKERRDNDLRSFCRLCAMIQADGRRRKRGAKSPLRRVKSAQAAWRGPDDGQCHQ